MKNRVSSDADLPYGMALGAILYGLVLALLWLGTRMP